MKIKSKYLFLLACIAFVGMGNEGCEPHKKSGVLPVTPTVENISPNQLERFELFTVISHGTFKAGYDDSVREIFTIKNNKTGEEYLGVTDCSLIKRIIKKKEDQEEAIDAAIDIAGSVVEALAE